MSNVFQCELCGLKNNKTILEASSFTIIECNNCKIAFTSPAPALPDYTEMDFHSKDDAENIVKLTELKDLPGDWQDLINLQVKMIAEKFAKDAQILEVGCGEGILLEELRKNGFTNLQGFEPSKTGAVRARKRGFDINNGYFSKEAATKKYDLIMMSHVFEHIEKPLTFMEDLNDTLNSKGAVLLTQTNFKGIFPRMLKEDWYAWVPDQHYWHFTIKGLQKLYGKKHFKLISSAYTTLVHPHNWMYQLANLKDSFKDQFIVILQKNA